MSIQSEFWKFGLKVFVRPVLKSAKLNAYRSAKRQIYAPAKIIVRNINCAEKKVQGFPVFQLTRKANYVARKVMIYIHGGGYAQEINSVQWITMVNLLKRINVKIIVPIYPLSKPNYSPTNNNLKLLYKVYKNLLKEFTSENILIVGDSAGGGLTLAFSQFLKIKKTKQPSNIILLSPWIDLTNTNQKVLNASKNDPFLPYEGIIMASKWYCQNKNPKAWKYSPIYGNLKGLGKISIFTSTGDCLYDDALKLHNMLNELKITHHYDCTNNLFHDFPMFPVPEAKPIWKYVAQAIEDR